MPIQVGSKSTIAFSVERPKIRDPKTICRMPSPRTSEAEYLNSLGGNLLLLQLSFPPFRWITKIEFL